MLVSKSKLLAYSCLIAASTAAAADPRKLGTQWTGPDDNTRITQLGLDIDGPSEPDPALYRRAQFDWRRSDLQAGFYPKASFAKRVQGAAHLAVDIDTSGKPVACRIAKTSGANDIDAHACPHVLARTRFVPTLSRDGTRRAETLAVSLEYSLDIAMIQTASDGPPPSEPPRVEPLQPIDAQLLGIAGTAPPRDVWGIGATLDVGPDGVPAACLLREPTRDDAWDRRICDALLERARFPAAAGVGLRRHSFGLQWPK